MTISVEVFAHIRANEPVNRIDFGSPGEARAYMFSPENRWTPMDMVKGSVTLCRNYPNVYAGTTSSREEAERRWKDKDLSWTSHDSPY